MIRRNQCESFALEIDVVQNKIAVEIAILANQIIFYSSMRAEATR
jgi:hypothetical protein